MSIDTEESLVLPSTESVAETVESFNNYFQEKIDKIRSNFAIPEPDDEVYKHFSGCHLSQFEPTTIAEIKEILKESGFKCSSNDLLPATILNDNYDIFFPHISDLVNLSLSSGSIDGVKLAHITPLIKGSSLDHSNFKNYRPISNLSFIGKLIERVVLRLNDHLRLNNLNIPFQSAYKQGHSTETLLICIVNDLLIASSENKATIVMLLDLSAAFDTVDHNKLINIIKHKIGVTGHALKWLKSFITGRCQKITIGDCKSIEITIKFGVPQGSVLGPVLFNIYIWSLYHTVHNLQFNIHGFADDHQVYKSFRRSEEYSVLVNDVPDCFKQIKIWMNSHYLQLNPGKTEIIIFGSPAILADLSIKGVFLDSTTCIRLSPIVKNLGFRLDPALVSRSESK